MSRIYKKTNFAGSDSLTGVAFGGGGGGGGGGGSRRSRRSQARGSKIANAARKVSKKSSQGESGITLSLSIPKNRDKVINATDKLKDVHDLTKNIQSEYKNGKKNSFVGAAAKSILKAADNMVISKGAATAGTMMSGGNVIVGAGASSLASSAYDGSSADKDFDETVDKAVDYIDKGGLTKDINTAIKTGEGMIMSDFYRTY
ncbi:hypothetical protein DN730_17420 [Marinomonas piezotolerans]|uniref:Uncharacterized protein n=1 Tax=Marinomonas piezotolerans TaxID=2213058 RepID=A0A370U4Z6_9GAMM|nr:hypothetical protein [Marinomonas piezotolerans]RDL42841.1 hypothetical protein DN730_17420 [Marinomonas piezotolerans]